MLAIAILLKNCSCKSGKTDTFDLALICYTPQENLSFYEWNPCYDDEPGDVDADDDDDDNDDDAEFDVDTSH